MTASYLKPGLPGPIPAPDGLDAPFWQGLNDEVLMLQRCASCRHWQWGPEWICHRCHSFDLAFEQVAPNGSPNGPPNGSPNGIVYSYERVWHPVHPALKDQGPYLIVLVALPHADDVRLVGNLLGDPQRDIAIGAAVRGVFEHHSDAEPAFTLLQWELKG